jgi:hypothetical protein
MDLTADPVQIAPAKLLGPSSTSGHPMEACRRWHTGMRKPWRTVFSDRDYQHVRELGDERRRNYPRAIAT